MTEHLQMTHSELIDGISQTAEFFALRGVSPKELVIEPLHDLASRLKTVDGYRGLMGVGYPFYALDEGSAVLVPSIGSYLENTKAKISESASTHGESWPCAECQIVNKLPNLTDICVPCEKVLFKPRDLFRALPDVDALAVFEETSDAIETEIEDILSGMNFIRFNRDIKGAFDNTMKALDGHNGARLPVDFHIVTISQLHKALDKMLQGSLEQQVGVNSRAWRARWKDQAVDISFSFAFSMTEIGQSELGLGALIASTRRALLERHRADQIVAMVTRSRRCGAVLGDMTLKRMLEERIQSW